jgi:hypothetical protein
MKTDVGDGRIDIVSGLMEQFTEGKVLSWVKNWILEVWRK